MVARGYGIMVLIHTLKEVNLGCKGLWDYGIYAYLEGGEPWLQGVMGLWYLYHFQQYFSYIISVSFIGGGNRSIRRK